MLNIPDICSDFETKRESINNFQQQTSEILFNYLHFLPRLDATKIEHNKTLPHYSGAKILDEGRLFLKFNKIWKKREDAVLWAGGVLDDVTIGCVDGSQIYPDKTIGIQIAVVQTASVINSHNGCDHLIDVHSRVVTPDEFELNHIYSFGKEFIDAKRFAMECAAIESILKSHDKVYAFLDGSLILSHTQMLNKNIRDIYNNALFSLLATSKKTGNPVIGYVEKSMQGDITDMMGHLYEISTRSRIRDALLLKTKRMEWGDRTKLFICNRDDRRKGTSDIFISNTSDVYVPSVLKAASDSASKPDLASVSTSSSTLDTYGEYRDSIAFYYIMMNRFEPSRVEIPIWAAGEAEAISNILRAQTVLRGEYPDILKRAHDAAVIRMSEHGIFIEILRNFCNDNGIDLPLSAKQIHKEI